METEFGISGPILNSFRDQICLLDQDGKIVFVNEEWIRFARQNDGDLSACGLGVNYIQACKPNDSVYQGLKAIISGEIEYFNHEYPCHSMSEKRWFIMQAARIRSNDYGIDGMVVRHVNITKQKLLELQLKEYADTDSLTSVYNRRYFEKKLKEEGERARKNGLVLSLLYIDTDNFKELNDTYGHAAGDEVLKELSRLILRKIRASDTFARIGGDEFAILFPETGTDDLKIIAGRIIEQMQQFKVQVGGSSIQTTISIGGSVFSEDFQMDTMLKKADKALYMAKERGKNQLVLI